MAEPSHAVFLSYASQDAHAAQKICEALRAAGIEVWFDKSELRGGDVWDQKIRREIHDCNLFVPIVSQHTQERLEGYFRHEWKLAIERTHHMAEQKPFLVPVVVDGTRDQEALVPDAFRAVQWTCLPGGDTPSAFVERIRRLLSPELSPLSAVSGYTPAIGKPVRTYRRSKLVLLAIVAVVVSATLAYFVADKFWISKHLATQPMTATAPAAAARAGAAPFTPPPHSIAVLPFVNMSGDKDQDYFSDGLSEELLNDLARINDLQVAARTSAFSFKGKDTDVGTIARKLNVGAVLEGSVRRSAHTVRVTAQLINAVTGFHMWSQTYDRDLGDALKLQTDIAESVAGALKTTLLGNVAAKIEAGSTHNAAALDAYLRAGKKTHEFHDENDARAAIAAYTEAIHLDPKFALGYAARSIALNVYAIDFSQGPESRSSLDKAKADARKATALAPELAEAHLALGYVYQISLNFAPASQEYERAMALAPGNAKVLQHYGRFAVLMGQGDSGLAAVRRAVLSDPLNSGARSWLGQALFFLRRYQEAVQAYNDAIVLDPGDPDPKSWIGWTYYLLGNLQAALASCKSAPQSTHACLAVVYNKLGSTEDAQAMLAKVRAEEGDDAAYFYAVIYAQWGDTGRALDWLEAAVRLRNVELWRVKVDPYLDPLRKEPRFQAVERALRFPD